MVEVIPSAVPPAVIDDGDAAYAETSGACRGWSGAGYYQGDCHYAPAGTGQNTATWTFDGLVPNKLYGVYAT